MTILKTEPLKDEEWAVLEKKRAMFCENIAVGCACFLTNILLIYIISDWLNSGNTRDETYTDTPYGVSFFTILIFLSFVFHYLYPPYTEQKTYQKDLDLGEKTIAELMVSGKEKSFSDKTFTIKTVEEEPFSHFSISEEEYNKLSIGNTFTVEYAVFSKIIFKVFTRPN
ncbi:MAG: hypothetical protein RI894_804 [Bacteroidota bacterium]|jgi:hypothetical protein